MQAYIGQLYREFPGLRAAGIKEPAIRSINDLAKGKKVEDESLFVIEGLWAYEKIAASGIRIKAFAFCPDFVTDYPVLEMVRFLIARSDAAYLISNSLCSRLSSRDGKEAFFMLCVLPRYGHKDIRLRRNNLVMVLDGLENPGNIGTIIRTVDSAGGDGVIICGSRVRRTNRKLIKASMGSGFMLPVMESDRVETIKWLNCNGFKVIVTDLQADKSYYSADYSGRIAIIAGNEIHGISASWYEQQCERVIIPMFGGADSLNVGVAASLVIYEASYRQRKLLERGM